MMANAMINSQNQDNWALSQNKMYEFLCILQYSETEFYDIFGNYVRIYNNIKSQ